MRIAAGKLPIVAVAVLLTLFVASCGGGDDDSTTVAQTQDGAGAKSAQDDSGGSTAKKHDDSGGGSAQFKTERGDNSMQEFGKESSESEFEQAAEAVHRFLDARVEEDWAAVCAGLSGNVVKGVKGLLRKSEQATGDGCAKAMETVFAQVPKSVVEGEAEADIGSLRVKGDRAFVIYRTAGDEVLALSMRRVGGAWKVAGLGGVPLN